MFDDPGHARSLRLHSASLAADLPRARCRRPDAPNERQSASLAYNAFDQRVFFAGSNGVPDAYEQPFHSLDIVYSYYPIERGGVTVLGQSIGVVYKFDVSYKF